MFLKLYFITLPLFLLLDFVWLGFVSKNFYKEHLGNLLKRDINWAAAIIFYLLFTIGLVLFVILPSINKGSFVYPLIYGALFGLITYATYDLTNLATLKNWPILVTIVDLAWGALLGGTVSTITYLLANKA